MERLTGVYFNRHLDNLGVAFISSQLLLSAQDMLPMASADCAHFYQ